MKKLFVCLFSLLLILSVAGPSAATVIDFESTPVAVYSQLNFADLAITNIEGDFNVVNASPGPPISGHSLLSWYQRESLSPFLVTFNMANVTTFKIGVGDYDQDIDNTYLEVYDESWNLLGSDYYQNPADKNGGDYLSVLGTAASIKYAKFWDADPHPGAVYWDNLTYDTSSVPEPFSMLLLGFGLVGLAGFRKRFKE